MEEERGDLTVCLPNLADQLGIDILNAAGRKLQQNKIKYPVEKAKGRADEYTELG